MKSYFLHTGLLFLILLTSCKMEEKKDGSNMGSEAILKTRWTDQVDPNHVLPEYPRPIQQRKEWMNLNGYWQIDTSPKQDIPFGTALSDTILVPFAVESYLSGVKKNMIS